MAGYGYGFPWLSFQQPDKKNYDLQVLDSGIMTSIDDFQRICNPKLVVFDLKTDQPIRRVEFPREVLRPQTLLANLIIDESIQGTCDSAFLYLADTAAPGTSR